MFEILSPVRGRKLGKNLADTYMCCWFEILSPVRGRKLGLKLDDGSIMLMFEILSPVRGRKPKKKFAIQRQTQIAVRNTKPRKGTETQIPAECLDCVLI